MTSFAHLVRTFLSTHQAAAAVEFALIFPVMMMIYFGTVVFTTGFSIDRKLTTAARTVGDLIGRAVTMDCGGLSSTVGAAATMVQPYSPAGMTVLVADVTVKNIGTAASPNLQAKVVWSQARNVTNAAGAQASATVPTAWAPNSVVSPIPTGYAKAGTSFIMIKADQDYVPIFTTSLLGTMKLSKMFNWPVRSTVPTSWTGTTTCP
jgi:Flp pilus assembly protein TadG